MVFFKLPLLALLALQSLSVFAQADAKVEDVEEKIDEASAKTPKLNVRISASFPESEIFGVKLVNGHPTKAVLDIHNAEPEPVTVVFIGGALYHLQEPRPVIRNLTTRPYNLEIPAGEKESLTYSFATELHPQDLTLSIATVISKNDSYFTMQGYNGTVSVVEAPQSIFDPQIIFLYLVLLACFGGTVYFIYNTWITTLFPQKKRGGKGGERAKTSSKQSKKVDPADQVSVVGADGPAVTSGAKAYDESWIPAAHLQRPEAKRVNSGRSGTPKTKARG